METESTTNQEEMMVTQDSEPKLQEEPTSTADSNDNSNKKEDSDAKDTDPTVEGPKEDESSKITEDEKVSDDDSSSSFTGSVVSDDDSDLPPEKDVSEMLIKATGHKEEGNNHFKAGELDKAVRSYRKGTNLLKPFNKNNTGDDQVKALLVTLQNNLSMVFFKQSKTKVSRDIATKSLKIDPVNVKALYRRAVAHKKMGDLEKARDDLKEAVKLDANNAAVKKELQTIKKALLDFKEKQKKAMQGAFSSGASSLYEDKEREKKLKEEEKKRAEELEKKAQEKRKVQWEDECVKRMAKNEPAISFEDWEKEQEAEAKKKNEEEEKRKKEERKARAAAKKAAAAASKKDDSDSDDDDDLTPAELASLRGYKLTADGRKTSYFTNEKKADIDIAPQRLEASSVPQLLSTSSGEESDAKKGRPSKWNQAGTWEEKDTTMWCTEQLAAKFKSTKFSMQAKSMENYTAAITKVENLTGHASVAITNGKKRYIFDYHAKLKFEIRDADVDEVLAKGTLALPDICSTHHDELEVNFEGWKKSPASSHNDNAKECLQSLTAEVRTSVAQWVEEFNTNY